MTYYLVDGTEENFYTAVFEAYNDRDCIITSERNVQLGLGFEVKDVATDEQKAARVRAKLNELDGGAEEDISLLLRSNHTLKENVAFEYMKLIVAHGGAVRAMLANPVVIEMTEIRTRVFYEVHRLKGLLRFMENVDGVLYAPYSPDNDITDILARHFAARFSSKKFVIHDVKRKRAALFDGNEIVITYADSADIYLSEYEAYFENLWRQYYNSVNIASRPHIKQMKGYMPVRYWKFLPEKKVK
ncbi:MAG: TIGR03915 family putative DNA repair protein [Clostridia bacterium]|nr:TIGR03915 family putative DNA repair protein [Clostridia bacterium]